MQGGRRERKKLKRGDQALLQALWEKYGGPTEISKKVQLYGYDVGCQAPVNWRLRGRVPHAYVKAVAAALDISPLGLNYATLANLTPDVPDWASVVKSYGLPKDVVESILFLKPPVSKVSHANKL